MFGFITVGSCPSVSKAADVPIPCESEPTDMSIDYDDVITCSINIVGDSDIFRFVGTAGHKV